MVTGPLIPLTTKDYNVEVARGLIPGATPVSKFGRNPDCDQAASATAVQLGRSIWDGGIAGAVNWVPPTTARTHALVSTDDEDGGAGTDTGALTMRILGLDSSFAFQQEDLTLNGTTPVNTASAYTMIYRMYVLTAGSTGRNLGDITATAATDSTVTAKISIAMNQTLMAVYQIPAGQTGYLISYYATLQKSGGAAKFADIFLMSKDDGGVWRVRHTVDVVSDANAHVQHFFNVPISFDAKTFVEIRANPSADAQDISAGFELLLMTP